MVTDQEPRYRLKDPSTGDIVGTLFAESDGALKLQEGTSGNENELTLATDGTISSPAVSAGSYPQFEGTAAFLSTDYSYQTADNLDKIPLDATSHDDGLFNSGKNAIIIPEGGRYLCTAIGRSGNAVGGDRVRLAIFADGQTVVNDERLSDGSPTQLTPSAAVRDFNAGASIDLRYQNFSNDDTVESGDARTYLHVQRVPRP